MSHQPGLPPAGDDGRVLWREMWHRGDTYSGALWSFLLVVLSILFFCVLRSALPLSIFQPQLNTYNTTLVLLIMSIILAILTAVSLVLIARWLRCRVG